MFGPPLKSKDGEGVDYGASQIRKCVPDNERIANVMRIKIIVLMSMGMLLGDCGSGDNRIEHRGGGVCTRGGGQGCSAS